MSLDDATRRQRRAADPAAHAWVAANAGSGKTRVLTDRVARLLLAGAAPDKILCLTYTKAAAAEMRARLFSTLGRWAMMEDEPLREALSGLSGGAYADLDAARRLFARALETPGGLKIQTIHAFCDSLLRRFPLEAGAPPGFRTLEGRERAALIERLLDEMAGGEALGGLAALVDEDQINALTEDVLGARALFEGPVDEAALAEAFRAAPPFDDRAARLRALEALNEPELRRLIAAWAAGTAKERERAATLTAALEVKGHTLAEAVIGAALTKTDKQPLKKPLTKKAQEAEPGWPALVDRLVELAMAIEEAGRAARAADRALRLARFGAALTDAYETAKREAGLLDFDDLVARASALLTRGEAAEWVLYRLDDGVEHILVDEAQDTAPAQWAVIRALAEAFHAGEGPERGRRTFFVVGDEKQSIYSFQGAAPGAFEEMRAHFAARFAGAADPMREEALLASFRSAPPILEAVDATFAGEAGRGLTAGGEVAHRAFHEGRAGRVELWPLIPSPETAEDPPPWRPVDMPAPWSPRLRLAGAVADHVSRMIREGWPLPGGGRPVEPGDVIILLKARAPMMAPIIDRLKRNGTPVGGADRLKLGQALAVKDLLSLMRVAVTPSDDLSLAEVLRSPLCDVSEEALFALAHGRDGTLWRALDGEGTPHPEARALIRAATDAADFLRPYEFLEMALIARGGRRRLAARLGREAEDAVDELLAQALAYEAAETPSLEGFLAWMEGDAAEVKREQEAGGGEVRVMSAHGAKGLEAPVVILPDTMAEPVSDRRRRLIEIDTPAGRRAAWAGPSSDDPAALAAGRAAARDAEEAEHRRLLYVAMTRAEDWLIIAGAGDEKSVYPRTWHGLAKAGLLHLGAEEAPAPEGMEGARLVWERGGDPALRDAGSGADAAARVETPDWLRAAPPAAKARERAIPASGLGDHDDEGGAGRGRAAALAYGLAVHAALEADTADARLAARGAAPDLEDPALDAALREADGARTLPDAARFFAAEALAEAPLALRRGGAVVRGRVDRMLLSAAATEIVDFKTDAAPPPPGEAPEAYLAQMGAYLAAAAALRPEAPARAFILWTAAGRLDPVDADAAAEAMDRALAKARLDPETGAS